MRNFPGLVVWLLVLAALFMTLLARGNDISRGITFQDGQRITAAELHQLVDNSTIQSSFFLSKPAAVSLESGATLLLYSPAGATLEKISATALLYNNTALITTQPEKFSPATNDYFLVYDTTGTSLSKVSAANIWSNSIAALTPIAATNLNLQASISVINFGTNGSTTLSNLFTLFPYTALFTNLPVRTNPTNFDEFLVAASDDSSNFFMRQISLAGLFTNPPIVTKITNTDTLLFWSTSTNDFGGSTNGPLVARIPITNLMAKRWASTNINLPTATVMITNAHNLGALPQLLRTVLVCSNADQGYASNDEVDLIGVVDNAVLAPVMNQAADSTNVYIGFPGGSQNWQIGTKGSGTRNTITKSKWNYKIYTTVFP